MQSYEDLRDVKPHGLLDASDPVYANLEILASGVSEKDGIDYTSACFREGGNVRFEAYEENYSKMSGYIKKYADDFLNRLDP